MERPCQVPLLSGVCFFHGGKDLPVFPPEPRPSHSGLAGTARSEQGRAGVWRGVAGCCPERHRCGIPELQIRWAALAGTQILLVGPERSCRGQQG